MSDGNKKILVFIGPPLAVVSFLAAFWIAGQVLGPTATAGGPDSVAASAAGPRGDSALAELLGGSAEARDERIQRRRESAEAMKLGEREADVRPTPSSQPVQAAPATPGAYPTIEFDDTVHEFGTVFENKDVEHSFRFENKGEANLLIEKVKTTCGCTVADYTKEPIAPGESGTVDVVFKTRRRKGVQKKTIFVYTNDPQQPQAKLELSGKVQPLFWMDPGDRVNLGEVERGQKIEDHKIRLVWLPDIDLKIENIQPRNPGIEVTQEPFEDGENRGIELTIRIPDVAALGNAGQLGRINESIQIETNNDAFRRQFVFVTGTLKREVMVRPHAITFGIARPGADAVRKVTVEAAEGFSLEEPTVECPLEFVKFEVNQVEAGSKYDIIARLDVDQVPVGKFFRDYLKIRTNSEDVPEISMLVTGRVLGPATGSPAATNRQSRDGNR
jgi:hypothetical protein